MNPEFYSFFLIEGLQGNLRIDGTICSEKRKEELKIRNFLPDKENITLLTLYLDEKFDYDRTYRFDMDLNKYFKSELTLSFNITIVWPSTEIPVKMFAALPNNKSSRKEMAALPNNKSSGIMGADYDGSGEDYNYSGDLIFDFPRNEISGKEEKSRNVTFRMNPEFNLFLLNSEITIRNPITTIFKVGRPLAVTNTSMISMSNLLNLNRNRFLFPIFSMTIDKTRDTFSLTLGPYFDYDQTYQLIGSQSPTKHATMDFKFDVKEIVVNTKSAGIEPAASIGIGVASAFCIVGIGAALIYKKRRTDPDPGPDPDPEKDSENSDIELVDQSLIIGGREFPKSTVKKWTAITVGKKLGEGQFGNVYKGFLYHNDYQR